MFQRVEGIQNFTKEDNSSLNLMWSAFLRARTQQVKNFSKTPTNPQIASHGSNYQAQISFSENGEGVVRSVEVVQVADYYPYGAMRVDEQYTSFDEQRKFTGHELDRETDLTYANARYYDQNVGKFLSQDSVYLAAGDDAGLDEIADMGMEQYLSDPQGLNSYAYARNNPLRYIDDTGEWYREFITGQQSWGSFQVELGDAANYAYDNNMVWKFGLDNPELPTIVGTLPLAIYLTGGRGGSVVTASGGRGAKSAYEIAKQGGKHAGLITKAAKQTIRELEKSVSSWGKQIASHKDKIANPLKYVKDWKSLTSKHRENQIKKWKDEIKTFNEQIDVVKDIIKKR